MSSEYTCTRHRHLSDVEEVWRSIYDANPLLSPYQSYDFCAIVASDYRFSHLRVALTPVFLEIRRDGVPIIIAPLWKKPAKRPPFYECYLFPDFCLCGYLDIVYAHDCTDEDFGQALRLIEREMRVPLTLRRVNETSLFGQYLLKHFEPYGDAPSAMVSFPDGYDAYFATLGKQTRQNVRTSHNRMRRDGRKWDLRVYQRQEIDEVIWGEVMRIHVKRKMSRDGVDEKGIRGYVARRHDPMERAIRTAPFNCLFMLTIDGVGAAYFTSFFTSDERCLVTPRLDMDDEFRFYSPGIVLISEAIKYLCENTEVRSLDLCHGDQKYKYVMGAHARTNYYFTIEPDAVG